MFCPSDVNTGFIQLIGPIAQADLKHITHPNYPLSISFAPRSTIPTMMDNRIDESTGGNTCTYNGTKFSLVDVQIAAPTNKGYILPGMTETPVAELILSFNTSANANPANNLQSLTGILLCVPIYNTGVQQYDGYLTSIVNPNVATREVPTLESVFYGWDGDTAQTSFGYQTCFETITAAKTPSSKSLYVFVFPHGIHMAADVYQKLLQKMRGTLTSYMVPPAIRGADATLRSYTFDNEGNKVTNTTSADGIIYTVPLSTCTEEFKNRFEYFSLPPRLAGSKRSKHATAGQCPYYQTTQYKCMPFNQLTDLSGAYVKPGNKSLDTILQEQNRIIGSSANDKPSALTTEDLEIYGGSIIGGLILLVIVAKVTSWLANRP